MKTEKPVKVNDAFIANGLRQMGYTLFSAILDIIDNSLEPNVNSSIVKVSTELKGENIKAVKIIDDGSGMSFDVLNEALSIGSQTGKTKTENLGCYGVGLKTAALSFGRCLEVWTKEKDSKKIYYGKLDLNPFIENQTPIKVEYDDNVKGDLYQYAIDNFIEDHGTIVRISNLDKISTRYYPQFKSKLKTVMGECYNKFITDKKCKFKVGMEVVEPVDIVGNRSGINVEKLSSEGSFFTVNDDVIRYDAWYIPSDAQPNGAKWLPRGNANSGLFIYRNNRLVGKGLSFGLLGFGARAKHDLFNGLRIEMFMNGESDTYTGSSCLKMITERDKDSLDFAFYSAMEKELKPYVKMVKEKDMQIKNDLDKNEEQKILDGIAKSLNINVKVHVQKDKTEKEKVEDKQNENVENQKKEMDENRDKQNRLRKMFKFDLVHLGENGPLVEYTDYISINVDHVFYREVYVKMDDNTKWAFAVIWASEFASRKEMNLNSSAETSTLFAEYSEKMSQKLMEIVEKLCPDIKNNSSIRNDEETAA